MEYANTVVEALVNIRPQITEEIAKMIVQSVKTEIALTDRGVIIRNALGRRRAMRMEETA